MNNGTEKYIETVAYLGKLYDFCNEKFFNGKLKKPVITIQRDERNKTFGWWSVEKVWKETSEDDGENELNITAQQLNRPIGLIAATLMHEMCHQYAAKYGLQCPFSRLRNCYTIGFSVNSRGFITNIGITARIIR